MNKNEFETELKELMSSMSEEEIEKTICALSGCRNEISKKSDREKGELARLLPTAEQNEAELRFVGSMKKEGTVHALGASLLTSFDFDRLGAVLPGLPSSWWLYDNNRIVKGQRERACRDSLGKIRPVLIVKKIDGELRPGESCYINEEKFCLLTPSLMIRTFCLEESCTYTARFYQNSVLKLCVDGWYQRLIRKNNRPDAAGAF